VVVHCTNASELRNKGPKVNLIYMKISFARYAKSFRTSVLTLSALVSTVAFAVVPQARITAPINNQSRVQLPGTLSPHARPALDAGAVPASTPLSAMTLVFSRTPAQQAALDALTAAQQNPASPEYHHFLTPEQFAAQFGAAASDIAATQAWLQQQGFTIQSVARSHDRILFAGTEGQVESAFGTQLHFYNSPTGKHFAPSTALTIPSALSSSVLTVTGLSSFRPKPHVVFHQPILAKPSFTSSQTGSFFLTPKDVATVYDVNPAYNAGYTGTGQTIAVIGQSDVILSDVTNFQIALGVTPKAPTPILVPNTGTSAVYSGDEAESDLDLEYSSAMAPGATIYFVYTGNDNNTNGVFASLQYAVTNKTANIITMSYGDCEADISSSEYTSLNDILEEGAAQGQTIVTSAGDNGSTDCWEDTNLNTTQRESLSADFPSTSQYDTSMGGTEFPQADISSTYFNTGSGSDVISSAKSYIPEQVWNDTAYNVSQGATGTEAISAGGGGISIFTPRPSWQSGVTGIPAGSYRLVPDISLAASPAFPGYLYCSSDTSSTGVTGSCSNGFRDANDEYLTVAGGTSFDAPIFAGLVAVLNQAKGYTAGQGLINPELYTLASSPSIYASAFHDITSGNNECPTGSSYASYCSAAGQSAYAATTGYDEASGLGSIDFYNLLTAWPASTTVGGLTASATTVSPATLSPASGANDVITITVASASGLVTTTPTGTVSVSVDGSVVAAALPLTNGVATYTFSSTTTGSHIIKATYSGNGAFAASSGSVAVNVGNISFTLSAPNITLATGASGSVNLTGTPVNGYTGTIDITNVEVATTATITSSNSDTFCGSIPPSLTITGATPVSAAIDIYTSASACSAAGLSQGGVLVRSLSTTHGRASNKSPQSPWHRAPMPAAFAGLMLAMAFTRRRSRKLRGLLSIALLALFGFGIANLTGCSNSSTTASTNPSNPTSSNAPTGVYTVYVTGQDSLNPALTATTSFTITLQ
jgi:subtilase family serine protease